MSILRGKWVMLQCDIQVSYDCTLSEEIAFALKGKRTRLYAALKEFKKSGWLVYGDFCICPFCAELVTKGGPK